jgi:hypothetical protein
MEANEETESDDNGKENFSSNVCCEIYSRRNILITIWKGFSLPAPYVKNI